MACNMSRERSTLAGTPHDVSMGMGMGIGIGSGAFAKSLGIVGIVDRGTNSSECSTWNSSKRRRNGALVVSSKTARIFP